MIYPPIDKLVSKTGNKYELVIATAKRAREIANAERAKEKEEADVQFSVTKSSSKADKNYKKPIVKAVEEISEGKVYITKDGEGYKTEGFGSSVLGSVMPSEEDKIEL